MTKFLQSEPWARFQQSRGRRVHIAHGEGWQYMAVHEPTRVGVRIYTPGGPIAESDDALSVALDDLVAYAKTYGAYCIRVEPELKNWGERDYLRSHGYQKAHKDINPADTVINDVSTSIEAIDMGASQTIRQIWKKNQREGVSFDVSYDSNDVVILTDMLREVSLRTKMQPHPDEYFEAIAASLFPTRDAGLMIARKDGVPIASLMFYTDGETLLYPHAASLTEYRSLSPATALMLFALHWAHETGHTYFDMYGVSPPGALPSHPWYGLSQFKRNFGGAHVPRSGTWELPLRKTRYTAITSAARLYDHANKLKRKL